MNIKSILVWPRSVNLGWSDCSENKSEDTHHSASAARSICRTLMRDGFGCNRQIFPVEARVEVDGVVVFRWTNSQGYLIDKVDTLHTAIMPKLTVTIEPAWEAPSMIALKTSAYQRANPNQPWYAQFDKRKKGRRNR